MTVSPAAWAASPSSRVVSLRFVIKEKALTMGDLDDIWAAQAGKHEAIVKNIHELLAKLAWDFSPDQVFKSNAKKRSKFGDNIPTKQLYC